MKKKIIIAILAAVMLSALSFNAFADTELLVLNADDPTADTAPTPITDTSGSPGAESTTGSEPVTSATVTGTSQTEPPIPTDTTATEPPTSGSTATNPPVTEPPVSTDTSRNDDPSIPDGVVFNINNGVLESCSGKAASVVVPDNVTHIMSGAFSAMPNLKNVTIYNAHCQVDNGAFPSGITVYALPQSDAHMVATLSNCGFSALSPVNVTLTITYRNESNAPIAQAYTQVLTTGQEFAVSSPVVPGYTPDTPVVEGYAVRDNINITVTYSVSDENGWKIIGNNVRFTENGAFLKSTSKTINGVTYTFDGYGNVVLDNAFLDIDGQTYYLIEQRLATGYQVIGRGIYFFLDSGIMLKNSTHDGYSFDINGTITGEDRFINVNSSTYYLYQNALYSGFISIDGTIYYFGDDYAMVKNGSYGSYTFDRTGALSGGINLEELTISSLPNVEYTGEAHTPSVIVKFGSIQLIEGIHYTVTYADNVESGTASVIIEGIGPVNGSVTLNFNIFGEDAYTLTIRYVNVAGIPIAPNYETKLTENESYEVPSPEVEGYKADVPVVKGVMGKEDITLTVLYSTATKDSSSDESSGPDESTKDVGKSTDPAETKDTSSDTGTADGTEKNGPSADRVVKFIIFLVIATVISGGLILAIINWTPIKRYIVHVIEKLKNKKKQSRSHNKKS